MQTQASHSPLTIYQKQPLNAGTPLDVLRRAFLTPEERFFIRCHGSIPEISPGTPNLSSSNRSGTLKVTPITPGIASTFSLCEVSTMAPVHWLYALVIQCARQSMMRQK